MTTSTIDRARLEELLGEYWEIAFEESSGVVATGNKANRVLHEIRALFDVKQAEIARLKAESEERLQNCAALDRPDARPHRYGVQGNDAWNHYGTRGQAMTTREAFEDWYEVDCYPCEHSNWFRLDSDGDYEFDEVQYAWRTWQAVTASALERAAGVCQQISALQLREECIRTADSCAEAIRALKDET